MPDKNPRRNPARNRPKTDGFEALYGPVPSFIPQGEWLDPIVVERVLAGHSGGRRPYVREIRAILDGIKARSVPLAVVARGAGVKIETVETWHSRYATEDEAPRRRLKSSVQGNCTGSTAQLPYYNKNSFVVRRSRA